MTTTTDILTATARETAAYAADVEQVPMAFAIIDEGQYVVTLADRAGMYGRDWLASVYAADGAFLTEASEAVIDTIADDDWTVVPAPDPHRDHTDRRVCQAVGCRYGDH